MDSANKAKKAEWKLRQKRVAQSKFPLQEDDLEELFDYLDSVVESCDHTLKQTKNWIRKNAFDESSILAWLEENGGFCDCEVIANVEDHFQENRSG